jgi:hypothetical protein
MSPTSVNELQILAALRQLPLERWGEVLAFVTNLGSSSTAQSTPPTAATSAELLQLPFAEREAILSEQSTQAEAEYANDPV